jgi:NADH-quinone oxidoreductase subunit L
VVTIPLILLAIPSIFAGYLIDPMVVGNFFHDAIYVNDAAHSFDPGLASLLSQHNAIQTISEEYHGAFKFILHGLTQWPFWLSISGVGLAAYIYLKDDSLANWAYNKFHWLYTLLDRKYYADDFNQNVFAKGSIYLGNGLWALGERVLIDGLVVNGSARVVGWSANVLRHLQTGYLYHYAFAMILGLIVVLTWFLFS